LYLKGGYKSSIRAVQEEYKRKQRENPEKSARNKDNTIPCFG
jgi:hypothetical protein